jgi:hypothetical protein
MGRPSLLSDPMERGRWMRTADNPLERGVDSSMAHHPSSETTLPIASGPITDTRSNTEGGSRSGTTPAALWNPR